MAGTSEDGESSPSSSPIEPPADGGIDATSTTTPNSEAPTVPIQDSPVPSPAPVDAEPSAGPSPGAPAIDTNPPTVPPSSDGSAPITDPALTPVPPSGQLSDYPGSIPASAPGVPAEETQPSENSEGEAVRGVSSNNSTMPDSNNSTMSDSTNFTMPNSNNSTMLDLTNSTMPGSNNSMMSDSTNSTDSTTLASIVWASSAQNGNREFVVSISAAGMLTFVRPGDTQNLRIDDGFVCFSADEKQEMQWWGACYKSRGGGSGHYGPGGQYHIRNGRHTVSLSPPL
ncbi:hypothetical protein C8F04DRAFT_678379 [Mycena alexandri]|uniref:Uncharacterized protein n=1 Tax=Mycena alexandri TaxID=1745969 RepID=A0AAD6WJY2_9AGAR|nr:hypothetical protein C8F04DRAFT_678379 [Mycena alexandri]